MKKIWITGAEGHIGTALLELLEGVEYQLLPTDIHEVDITKIDEVTQFVYVNRPDVIINCAGMTDVVDKVADHARKLKSTGRSRILVVWNLHRAALCRIAEYFVHKIAADPVNPGASDDDKAVQKLCQDFLSGLF